MEKTIAILSREFLSQLTNLINNSKLPLCLMEYILSDVLNNVKIASQKQYELDLKEYNNKSD